MLDFFYYIFFLTLLHLTGLQKNAYKFLIMLHYYQILDSVFSHVFFHLAQVLYFFQCVVFLEKSKGFWLLSR